MKTSQNNQTKKPESYVEQINKALGSKSPAVIPAFLLKKQAF
jgi:hypothetical protein